MEPDTVPASDASAPPPGPPAGPRSLAARLHVNRRTLQIALGIVWIFDGLLKFQPDVLKPSFAADFIRPMADGQPTLLASTIDHMANFLSHEATAWVVLFGLIEIAIGVGLLFRRTVKQALVVSFIWGAGVYMFGEGLGMVLTGHTSPLQGAPGRGVLLRVARRARVAHRRRPGPSTGRFRLLGGAGRGLLGGTGALLVWAAIWIVEAMLWMLPFNRTGNAIADQMSDTS